MNNRRLTVLAKFLEECNLPPHKFNLLHWVADYGSYDRDDVDQETWNKLQELSKETYNLPKYERIGSLARSYGGFHLVKPIHCRTAACAVGWACSIPEFNAEGLFLLDNDGMPCPIFAEPDTEEVYTQWVAVRKFFDLSQKEADYLFQQEAYMDRATPEIVANRIREFIRNPVVRYGTSKE